MFRILERYWLNVRDPSDMSKPLRFQGLPGVPEAWVGGMFGK